MLQPRSSQIYLLDIPYCVHRSFLCGVNYLCQNCEYHQRWIEQHLLFLALVFFVNSVAAVSVPMR